MLQYPSINGIKKSPMGRSCVVFYKYDGSNLRFEWNPKKGWGKFGSRTQLIDRNAQFLGVGIDLFLNTMADNIIDRLKAEYGKKFSKYQKITAFAELYGPSSFAGTHVEDEPKELKLFDIFRFKDGFLDPADFVDMFESTNYIAEPLRSCNLNQDLISNIRKSYTPDGIELPKHQPIPEGVVCKGVHDGELWMTKIKTLEYLEKLKNFYPKTWEQYADDQ